MSTMLETYDTHMDYIDIDMHHQPVEPWFDSEAKMDDDVLLENHLNDHESTQSVEVDMEDNYGENEYEMADGEGEEYYEEMSSDLLDIEVYDASEPLEDAAVPRIVSEPVDAAEPPPFDMEPPETANSLLVSLAVTPAMSPVPQLDTELPDPDKALASEHEEVAVEEHEDQRETDDQPASDPPLQPITSLPEDGATEEVRDEEPIEVPQPAETEHAEVPQPEEHVESSETAAPHRDVDPAAADPHEISEGVYIDPPPAVLVSFESSDYKDVCLFNQPFRSRSPTPTSEGHGPQVYTLLLHHRPILYYEPLASLFDALRQEEHLAHIPHFADSELVLDAYDLQLVISEDNVHAREVTLHDLNVLHDASNVTGPLRLRLSSIVPRFILRYHLLQEKVSRLHIATGDEEGPPDESPDYKPQDQEKTDSSQGEEPQNEDAPEEAYENPVAVADENAEEPSNGTTAQEHEIQDDAEANDAEAETDVKRSEGAHEDAQESSEAEEYVEPSEEVDEDGEGSGEGSSEQVQHGERYDGGQEEGLPGDEQEEKVAEPEEGYVIVENLEPETIIPLTGANAEDTGNDFEKASNPLLSSTDFHDDSGASNTENHEDAPDPFNEDPAGALANKPLDLSAPDDAAYDEESYEEDDGQWEGGVDGDGDTTWEAEEQETASNESSVTLSSKASKRSFDEVEYADDEVDGNSPPGSPGAKRTRID